MIGKYMSAAPDLKHQKFGKLTVIERLENSKHCQSRWKCLCDCGNYIISTGHRLSKGLKNSCGCANTRFEDITGQIFGKLTAIELVNRNPTKWKCKCECGNVVVRNTNHLKSSATNCGCSRKMVDLLGQIFGKLTVIERDVKRAGWFLD